MKPPATRESWLVCPFKFLKVLHARVWVGCPDSGEWALSEDRSLFTPLRMLALRTRDAPPYTEFSGKEMRPMLSPTPSHQPPQEAPVCPRWEARAILIELPNHLFKLDMWCVMTPGWTRESHQLSSAGTRPAGTRGPTGCRSRSILPEAGLAGWGVQGLRGKGS